MKMFYDWGERIPLYRDSIHLNSPDHMPVITTQGELNKTRKRFLKTSISVDTAKQVITGLKTSQHPVHDALHAEKLLKQSHRARQSNLDIMDKGI
jgi:RNA:NAD 2'-phosphotransferase (TPT1/KptA family)